MKSLVRLTELKLSDIYDIFRISDEIHSGKYNDILKGKSVILFFPIQVLERVSHLKREYIY